MTVGSVNFLNIGVFLVNMTVVFYTLHACDEGLDKLCVYVSVDLKDAYFHSDVVTRLVSIYFSFST